MKDDVTARLLLSHVVEPSDPRLKFHLESLTPSELWARVEGRHALPASWLAAAKTAERRVSTSLEKAAAAGLRWITPNDDEWPEQLNDLDGPDGINGVAGAPLGLWVAGDLNLKKLVVQSVGIVGARNCTTYGAEMAMDVAADCAEAGFTVISGAAFGIDACAHRGALSLDEPTVAVMACGADVDYPRAHAAMLERVMANGLIVSEFAPGEPPQKHRFLVRNRIIAALATGTLVIEAAKRSGSLNTLHWADQLGRITMGLPGPVNSAASTGVHAAIREGKAVLVTDGAEILSELIGLGNTLI